MLSVLILQLMLVGNYLEGEDRV